jgi:hypothetical protein
VPRAAARGRGAVGVALSLIAALRELERQLRARLFFERRFGEQHRIRANVRSCEINRILGVYSRLSANVRSSVKRSITCSWSLLRVGGVSTPGANPTVSTTSVSPSAADRMAGVAGRDPSRMAILVSESAARR